VKCAIYLSFWPSTATSRWLPGKRRHFRVTCSHMSSRDVISCHVTASSCKLQPRRKWNVQYMRALAFYSPSRWRPVKWHHFRVTSGYLMSRDVISCQVTAFFIELQPCRKWNVQHTRVFDLLHPLQGDFIWCHLWITSGDVRSRDVVSCHVTASSCKRLPCR